MTKMELVQKIGDEVCEGCGVSSDCGIDPFECPRIEQAISLLDKYASQPDIKADAESRAVCPLCGLAGGDRIE